MQKAEAVYPDESQKKICDQYGMPVQEPEEMVALATDSLGQSPIYGTRVQLPEGGSITWFIHCGEYSTADEFYKPVHVHHLSEMLPEVVNYLCLPTGAKFIIDNAGYEDVWLEA